MADELNQNLEPNEQETPAEGQPSPEESARVFADAPGEVDFVVEDEEEPAAPAKPPEPKGRHKDVDDRVSEVEIQRRMNELKFQAAQAEREREAARRELEIQKNATKALERHYNSLRETTKTTQGHALVIAEEKAKSSIQAAEREIKAAREAGDPDREIAAMRSLAQAENEVAAVEAAKASGFSVPDLDADTRQAVEAAKQEPQQQQRSEPRPVDHWRAANPWFNHEEANTPGTASSVALHFAMEMEREGYDMNRPEFWGTLNRRLEAAVNKMNEEQKQRQQQVSNGNGKPAASPVAPPARTGTNGRSGPVRLTQSEAQTAIRTLADKMPGATQEAREKEACRRYAAEKAAMVN